MKITNYDVKTIYRDEISGNCTLTDTDNIAAKDFIHIKSVLIGLGFTSYADENNRPHFKKYDANDNYTTFIVFDPCIE